MRMRTIDQAHAALVEEDPGCALAKSALRRMVVSGKIPSVRAGSKYLVDLDRLPELLFAAGRKEPEAAAPGVIRRLDARCQGA